MSLSSSYVQPFSDIWFVFFSLDWRGQGSRHARLAHGHGQHEVDGGRVAILRVARIGKQGLRSGAGNER